MLGSKVFYARGVMLLALVSILVSAGCANDTIRVRDRNAVAGAGRVKWQAVKPTEKKVLGFGGTGVALEGELSYVSASHQRPIAAGDQTSLGNTTFAGPATARSRAKLVDVTASARSGLVLLDMLRVEPFLGLQLTTVDLEVSSAGVQESDLTTAGGVTFGLRAGLQPHELIEFYGLYAYGNLFGGDSDNKFSVSQKLEVGARLLPVEHFGLFVAYREFLFYQIRDSDSSDAKLDFRGPILGLEMRF